MTELAIWAAVLLTLTVVVGVRQSRVRYQKTPDRHSKPTLKVNRYG